MKNGIILSAIVFTLSLTACSNYLEEFEDEYRDSAYAKTDIFSPTESSASIIDAGDSSGTSSKDASSSDARAEGQSSGKTDEEYDCYMNDSACISKIANEFDKTVRLLDSRNNNVYTAIYVGGLYFETAGGESVFDDSVSFLLMTENLEYEGDSVTALDTNGVFFYTYENAEKACPTGWRLPKITPEWSFLLKGEGSQFYIELPDNENGCYTNGEFDSGKSIFYWAQKEGETSWFVQKNYLANDNSELPKKCNAFPVRCVKEFGRYADYAGSSSSSGETKSSFGGGNTSLSVLNCDDFGGDTLYDSDNVGGHVLWNNGLKNYGYDDDFVSNIVFDDKVEFCVEYKDVKKDSIPMAYLGNPIYGYFYKYLSKDASAATFTINSNSDSCTTAISSTSKACESSNRQNVMENFKKIVIQNATATKIMVKGEYTIEYLSSSSSSVKSQSSSSSNISSSSGLQNCEAFKKDGGKLIYPLNNGDYGFTKGTSIYNVTSDYHLELNEDSEFCIEFTDKTKSDVKFTFGFMYPDTSVYFTYSSIEINSLAAEFEVDKESCLMNDSTQKTIAVGIECGENAKGNALKNINYFYYDVSYTSIKNIYVKNAEIKKNSSSSSEPATTCPDEDDGWHTLYDSSDSDQINGNPFQVDLYSGYRFEGSSGSKDFSEIDSICIEYKKTTKDVELDTTLGVRLGCYNDSKKELKYQYVVPIIDNQKFNKVEFSYDLCDTENSHEACYSGYIVYMELPNPERKNVTVQKIMYKGVINDVDICNSNALYVSSILDAAKCFKKNLSGSSSGTLLYDASKGDTLTNGKKWLSNGVTTTFQENLMIIESSAEQPYFAFNANPTGENEAVDISDWDGLCLVYASNVPLELRTDVDGSLAVDTFPAVTTPSWQCIGWPKDANLTNVSQLKLTPVDANGITPVVYIQKVYTQNKTVKVLWEKGRDYEDGYVQIDDKLSSSKSIAFNFSGVNISLFDSATVDVDDDEILKEFLFYKKKDFDSGASSCIDGGYCTEDGKAKKAISLIMYDSDNRKVSSDELAVFPVLGAFFSFDSEKTSNPINSITLIPKSWYAPLSPQ